MSALQMTSVEEREPAHHGEAYHRKLVSHKQCVGADGGYAQAGRREVAALAQQLNE
jgi:hypothetical protein